MNDPELARKILAEQQQKDTCPYRNPRSLMCNVLAENKCPNGPAQNYRTCYWYLNADKGIEPGVIIMGGGTIGENVSIRRGTIIYPYVIIEDDVKIGHYCIIRANSRIPKGTIVKDFTSWDKP